MLMFNEQLKKLVENALLEDVGEGDHSTLCSIDAGAQGEARLLIKEDGILAGVEVAKKIFESHEWGVSFNTHLRDGSAVKKGDIAFDVQASIHTILKLERIVLNCMQRMSGIATLTSVYVNKLKPYRTKILDTRKTTPNFRLLEKEAVRIGGGINHRMGLYDMIMLKDNHIDYSGGIETAIGRAWEYVQREQPGLEIEVEARSLDDVRRVLAIGKVNRIMLDNFSPADVATAVGLIQGKYVTEASGGITLDNIEEYAKTGVDYISAGALIHQARSMDLSLKARLNS